MTPHPNQGQAGKRRKMTKEYKNRIKARIVCLGIPMGEFAQLITEAGEKCSSPDLSRALSATYPVTPKNARIIEKAVTILRDRERGKKKWQKREPKR